MTRLALSSVDALHEAVQAFETYKDPHTLDERIIEVNRIEAEGDLVYKNALRKLYTAPGAQRPAHPQMGAHLRHPGADSGRLRGRGRSAFPGGHQEPLGLSSGD